MDGEPRPEPDQQISAAGAAAGLGFSLVATLVLFIGGGIFLDQRFDTSPILTLIGVAIGLVGAGYQLYELTLIGRKDRPAGPVGRRIERRLGQRSGNGRPPSGSAS